MAYKFYAGSTFSEAGTLSLIGGTPGGTSGLNGDQPDYSQWSLSAALFDQTGETQIATLATTNLSNPALPATNGLYQLDASSSDTASWPLGKAQLVLRAITDAGAVIYADPIWFRIQATPKWGN